MIGPGRVAVDFTVSGFTEAGYTGQLTISNSGPVLERWSIRMPVGGSVTGADGATWTQEGDTLVLTSIGELGPQDEVFVTFAANGPSTSPDSCELVGGSCRIGLAGDAVAPAEPKA